MVGFIISPKVIAIPLATAATFWYASVILEAIFKFHYRRSGPDLVLGASARLPFRYALFGAEGLDGGALAQRLQFALGKSVDHLAHLAIRFHQKQRGNIGNAERVAGRIASFRFVQQG